LLLSKVQKTEVCVESPASALKTTLPAFAAERRRLRQYQSIAAGAVLQAPALNSKCG